MTENTTKLLQPEDLRTYEGHTIAIKNHTFELYNAQDMGGEWVIWESERYRVYATPNYEMEGIPIDLRDADTDYHIDSENIEATVTNIHQYIELVRGALETLVTRIKTEESMSSTTDEDRAIAAQEEAIIRGERGESGWEGCPGNMYDH